MSYAIEFDNVWKKFQKGEKFNSLRDAIPAFFQKIAAKRAAEPLEEKEFWALKNVSFQVKKGEVIGIMGPNGAGKSTILKLLSKIMYPTRGEMKINGRLSALIEVTAGFHPELTGRENVYLNGTILGMRKKEVDRKFDEIVEFSGVGEFIDTPVKRYSSGMYSRLGFSVAANMDPEILLVDEVLSVGDMAFQTQCAEKMRELLKSGATVILVSHYLALIQNLCKRIILLNQGEVLKDGTVEEVIPHYQSIVSKKIEKEFRSRIPDLIGKVELNTQTVVTIPDVRVSNEDSRYGEEFSVGEKLKVEIDYRTRAKIESPIIQLEIFRSDSVLCCSLLSGDYGFILEEMNNHGIIEIDLGKINLFSGIYLLKVSIWDRDMIHPYCVHSDEVIRILDKGEVNISQAVFSPVAQWRVLEKAYRK